MQILDIDVGGIDDITQEIKEIIITGEILQLRYKNGEVTTWKVIQ